MKLTDLIESLQDIADSLGEDKAAETEVQLMYQPSYPLRSRLAGVVRKSDAEAISDQEDESTDTDEPEVVYLLEGTQLGYGNRHAWGCRSY